MPICICGVVWLGGLNVHQERSETESEVEKWAEEMPSVQCALCQHEDDVRSPAPMKKLDMAAERGGSLGLTG